MSKTSASSSQSRYKSKYYKGEEKVKTKAAVSFYSVFEMLRTSGVAAEAEAIYYNMAKFEMAKKSFANVHIEAGPQLTHTMLFMLF